MTAYTAQPSFSTVASSAKTCGILATPGSGMRRLKLYEFDVGASSAPNATDCNITIQLLRSTANGTSTAFTPLPLDPGDAACVATFGNNATIEPTYTANAILYTLPFNQRASYRWTAKDGKEFVIAASATLGIGMTVLSPNYTGNFGGTEMFDE